MRGTGWVEPWGIVSRGGWVAGVVRKEEGPVGWVGGSAVGLRKVWGRGVGGVRARVGIGRGYPSGGLGG